MRCVCKTPNVQARRAATSTTLSRSPYRCQYSGKTKTSCFFFGMLLLCKMPPNGLRFTCVAGLNTATVSANTFDVKMINFAADSRHVRCKRVFYRLTVFENFTSKIHCSFQNYFCNIPTHHCRCSINKAWILFDDGVTLGLCGIWENIQRVGFENFFDSLFISVSHGIQLCDDIFFSLLFG